MILQIWITLKYYFQFLTMNWKESFRSQNQRLWFKHDIFANWDTLILMKENFINCETLNIEKYGKIWFAKTI